jgi:hypothetical protein
MRVFWSSGFTRSFKKITKKKPHLKERITEVLILLADDPFNPSLKSLDTPADKLLIVAVSGDSYLNVKTCSTRFTPS